MMKMYLILLVCAMALFGCGPSPQDYAEADVMRSQEQQAMLDATQAREQQIKLDAIAVQEAEREQAVKDAALANAKLAAQWVAFGGGIALTISLVMVILAVGASGSIAIYGSGRAVARAAWVKANLIYLDPKTGQYPLLTEYVGKGVFSLTNANTEKTLMLDSRNESDRLAIRGAIAIQHALVMSNAASKSQDPSGVSIIQPLVIDDRENNDERI